MMKSITSGYLIVTRPQSRGFTLIEMIMSLTIVSVIMVSIGSVMVMMSKAIPTEDSDSVIQSRNQRNLLLLKRELEMATEITSITSNSISFTVPDRDSDGRPEELVVSNSGDNQPLIISYNGTLEHQLLGQIDNFDIQMVEDLVDWEITPPVSVTGNTTFYTHNPVPDMNAADQSYYVGGVLGIDLQGILNGILGLLGGGSDPPSGPTVVNFQINTLDQGSYFFTPTVPANTIHYQINQLSFYALHDTFTPSGTLTVQLCTKHPTLDEPGDTVLQSATVTVSTRNFSLHTAVFDTPVQLIPGQPLHVRFIGTALDNVYVGFYDHYNTDQPEYTTSTQNGGITWATHKRWRLPCVVQGVATIPPDSTFSDNPVHCKGVYLYWRDQEDEEYSRTVQFLNAPEIR